jgi:hypothetical protein
MQVRYGRDRFNTSMKQRPARPLQRSWRMAPGRSNGWWTLFSKQLRSSRVSERVVSEHTGKENRPLDEQVIERV